MRILVSLVLAFAVMAALVIGITFAGMAVAGSAGKAFDQGPMKSGLVPRISFILLWVLVFGVSFGLIGAD
ncbi:hypothetical protein [Tropicimonas isoalkanivorans]|uniref:Uncharacterized protein n=1 Tax=Tropicimonas isoalkanivorans TaxID=441112 RepID=A0A1I1JXR1_9RHOB|nr:hypothetical protein [Tropicimonas isoalkanivorans]SFC51258.1 hypothetical protein SAMN04488094_105240 [Tropicimonas isoalkanivorans]